MRWFNPTNLEESFNVPAIKTPNDGLEATVRHSMRAYRTNMEQSNMSESLVLLFAGIVLVVGLQNKSELAGKEGVYQLSYWRDVKEHTIDCTYE